MTGQRDLICLAQELRWLSTAESVGPFIQHRMTEAADAIHEIGMLAHRQNELCGTDQMTEEEDISPVDAACNITPADAYRAILRAMLLRNNGRLRITAEEMPTGPYLIVWRAHPEGGLAAELWEGEEEGKLP